MGKLALRIAAALIALVAAFYVLNFYIYWQKQGGELASAEPAAPEVPLLPGEVVATPNGFFFNLPQGWRVGEWQEAKEHQEAVLFDAQGVEVATVQCPSLGTQNMPGMVMYSEEGRAFPKDGALYEVTFSVDALETEPEVATSADILVWPNDLPWNDAVAGEGDFSSTCAVSASVAEGETLSASVLAGMRVLYDSWQ